MPPSQQCTVPSNILSSSERQERKPCDGKRPSNTIAKDGILVEGVVDLAFQEDSPDFNGWTVVDFKTDHEIGKAEDQYCAQVAAYVEAVRAATKLPARGFVLVV
jgi:ATP-dependent exoDNAse (exonuclease V) beta subunit